jgi:ferritin-like metal-binding protein YciE
MPTNAAYHLGGTAKPAPMVAIDPERLMLDEDLAAMGDGTGLNGPFVADMLSDMLMHERCGYHLYKSVAGRSNNPMLKRQYVEFGAQTEMHIEVLEELITTLGGDPGYTSPISRATEKLNFGALEGSFMLSGSVDLMDQEMVMLNAVVLAETIDSANWETLAALAESLADGEVKTAMNAAVERVLPQEKEHIDWPRQMRQQMMLLQARSKAMQTVGLSATALMDKIHTLFDDAPVPT